MPQPNFVPGIARTDYKFASPVRVNIPDFET